MCIRDRGWHLAPSNNQDNHKGNWGDSNTGRTVVLADTLDREAIYDAIRNYRVYATEAVSYTHLDVYKRQSYVSIDNVTVISEYPDELVLSSTADSVKAGQTVVMDYVAQRAGTEVTKHPVTWSVYDADNANPIDDGSVSISADGVLSADISSQSQTVTVRAEATLGENVLMGTTVSYKHLDVYKRQG